MKKILAMTAFAAGILGVTSASAGSREGYDLRMEVKCIQDDRTMDWAEVPGSFIPVPGVMPLIRNVGTEHCHQWRLKKAVREYNQWARKNPGHARRLKTRREKSLR